MAAPRRHNPPRRALPLVIGGAALALGLLIGWLLGRAMAPDEESATDQADDRPATTVTSAAGGVTPTTGGTAAGSRTTVVGPAGSEISFVNDPANPDARVVATGTTAASVTRLAIGQSVWQVADGRVTVRRNGRTETVALEGVRAASLYFVGGSVWVIDAAETRIAAVDPATAKAVAGVKRISQAAGGSSVGSSTGG